MNENISTLLKDWIPYKFFEEDGIGYARWLYLGDDQFTEPFFSDTIDGSRQQPCNSQRYSPTSSIEILPEWSRQQITIPPTAFIFHISRCGSTLVSQLLGLNPANIVLSEVPFFDELLRWGHRNNTMTAALPVVKAAMSLYGTKRKETQQRLFIKTDSWHIHFYKQLRALYPETPFILLYRQPDEVIRSHQKRRGMQAVPGVLEPEIFGFNKNEITYGGLDEYMARVIESYLEAFIDILRDDKLSLPVNYNEGALPVIKRMTAFCGIPLHEHEMEEMRLRSAFHGKYPGKEFSEPMILQPAPAYLDKAFELYNQVERINAPAAE